MTSAAVNASILMQLREVSFDKLNDDLMSKLNVALVMYNNLFDYSSPHLNHMKQSLEIAKSLGIDTQKRERSDESRLCFEAALVLVLANRPEGQAVQYQCMNRLLREYPEFFETEEIEQTKLLHFRNLMAVALLVIPANHNRAHLLNLITRLTEGRCVKYVTGSGAMRSTRRRVLIYEREGKIVPTIRPPRKDSKPPRKPPRRKRKRELPPGCTNELVTNTYNDHSLRLLEDDAAGLVQDQTGDMEELPMFIHIPTKAKPISSMKVPTSLTIAPQEMALEIEFHGFLETVWNVGISTPCHGWTGTFLDSVTLTTANIEEVEHNNRAKSAYMKCLELFYFVTEKVDEDVSVPSEVELKDPYIKDCFEKLVQIFDKSKLNMTTTHREHIKILGLFFCLQRCTRRGLIQYFGDLSIRTGSDICLDYIQAVEVYFTMLFRLSCHSPDSKSTPVMLIALENSFSRVMEIYIHLKSGMTSGVIFLHQTSWALTRESLYTEFYMMRQHALMSSKQVDGDDEHAEGSVEDGDNETEGQESRSDAHAES